MTADTFKFTRDKYVEKVRGLLAKAEGAATQDEADAFYSKAQELITKWEIETLELMAADTGPRSWVIVSRVYPVSSYSPRQDAFVINAVARGMGMRGYQTPYQRGYSKATAVVFGTEDDFERFEMMLTSIQLQLSRAMRAGESATWNRNQQRTFRLGFKMGYGNRIEQRLTASRSKATGTSLVLVGKDNAIELALPGDLVSSTIKFNGHAGAQGEAAANRADIDGSARMSAPKAQGALT